MNPGIQLSIVALIVALFAGGIAYLILDGEQQRMEEFGYRWKGEVTELKQCRKFCGSEDVLFSPSKIFTQMICKCRDKCGTLEIGIPYKNLEVLRDIIQ